MVKVIEYVEITESMMVEMEKASRLNIVTGFELDVLSDRKEALLGNCALISAKQHVVIAGMAARYDAIKGRDNE